MRIFILQIRRNAIDWSYIPRFPQGETWNKKSIHTNIFFLFLLVIYYRKRVGRSLHGFTEEVVFLFFFSYLMLQMKNENRYSGSYFYIPFSVFKVGKGKRKLDYPILIFHYGIGEWKTKGRYIQHVVVFRLSCFHLANENGYNGSYFYFAFFVWGLEKRKRMLSYPFSIFYYEIEKRKTKGRCIHGPIFW